MVATVAPNRTGPSPPPASIANAGPLGTTRVRGGAFDELAPSVLAFGDATGDVEFVLVGLPLALHADPPRTQANVARAPNHE